MENIRVRVENGRLVGDAPPGLPEGTELELRLVDPGDDLTAEELASLNRALESAWRSVRRGETETAENLLARLRHAK